VLILTLFLYPAYLRTKRQKKEKTCKRCIRMTYAGKERKEHAKARIERRGEPHVTVRRALPPSYLFSSLRSINPSTHARIHTRDVSILRVCFHSCMSPTTLPRCCLPCFSSSFSVSAKGKERPHLRKGLAPSTQRCRKVLPYVTTRIAVRQGGKGQSARLHASGPPLFTL